MNRIACAFAALTVSLSSPAFAGVEIATAPLQPAREVVFPVSGLKLRLPRLASEWRLEQRGYPDSVLVRARPADPFLSVTFAINGTRRSSECEAVQRELLADVSGSVQIGRAHV